MDEPQSNRRVQFKIDDDSKGKKALRGNMETETKGKY